MEQTLSHAFLLSPQNPFTFLPFRNLVHERSNISPGPSHSCHSIMSHGCQFWSINLKACLVLYFLTLPSFTSKTIPQSRSVYSTEIIDVSDWGDQPMFEELPLAVAYGIVVQVCWSPWLLRLTRKLLSPSTARLDYYQFHKAGSNIPYAAEQWHISGFKLFKLQIFKSTKMSFFFSPKVISCERCEQWRPLKSFHRSIFVPVIRLALCSFMYSISHSSELEQ